jgi:hypothetical protein
MNRLNRDSAMDILNNLDSSVLACCVAPWPYIFCHQLKDSGRQRSASNADGYVVLTMGLERERYLTSEVDQTVYVRVSCRTNCCRPFTGYLLGFQHNEIAWAVPLSPVQEESSQVNTSDLCYDNGLNLNLNFLFKVQLWQWWWGVWW